MPRSFVFGLVDGKAFSGEYKKNPFHFQHFNISSIGLTINGEEIPFAPMQLSFGANNSRFVEAFYTQFSGTGKMYYDVGNGISRQDFSNRYAVYAFDLTPDKCGSSSHFNERAPAAAVNLVCYGEFENVVQIDSERNVIYDHSD